jgi:hypothetical protein
MTTFGKTIKARSFWAEKFKVSSERSASFAGFYSGDSFGGGDFAGADLSFGQDSTTPVVVEMTDPSAASAATMAFATSASAPGGVPSMSTDTGLTPEQNAILAAQMPVLDSEAVAVQSEQDANILAQGNAAFLADKPIALTPYQQWSQAFLKGTGQLNAKGDGPGSGFLTSPIGLGLIGVGGLVALVSIAKIKG